MRISDWSSDVCSSDLRNAIALLQPVEGDGQMLVIDALQQRLMKHLVLPPAQRRVFLRQLVERHRQADIVLAVAGHDRKRRIRLGHFGHDPPRTGSAADAQKITRLHPLRLADRSEEHTSELQSLMRISYAV